MHVRLHTDVHPPVTHTHTKQSKNEPTKAHGQSLPHPPSLAFQEGRVAPRLIPSCSQVTLLSMWDPIHRAFLCISRMYASLWACSHYNRPRISVSEWDTQTCLRPRTSFTWLVIAAAICLPAPWMGIQLHPTAPTQNPQGRGLARFLI